MKLFTGQMTLSTFDQQPQSTEGKISETTQY